MKQLQELLKESLDESCSSTHQNFEVIITEKFDLTEEEIKASKNWRTPTEQLALVKELVKAGTLKSTGKDSCELSVNGLTVEFKIKRKFADSKVHKSIGASSFWAKPGQRKAFPDYFAELYLIFNLKGDSNVTEVLLKRFNSSKLERDEKIKMVELVNKKIKLLNLSFDTDTHW